MRVAVRLQGELRSHAPCQPVSVDIPDGSSVSHLLDALHMPRGKVGAASVNGVGVFLKAELREGNLVELFPPVAGG